MVVFVAKKEIGGASGYVWEKDGAEGAIPLPWHIAVELLALPGEPFFVVEKPAKKATKEVITEVVEQTAEVAETPAVTTKRRSTKE
jgi:hypothetical protein